MKTVFVFPGQGSHHFQMGRELFDREPSFRASMQHADRLIVDRCGQSILAKLFALENTAEKSFDNILHTHPAIFMVEYALAKALIDLGVQPDMVLGVSLGAFAASAVAGFINSDAALMRVIDQAIALERHCEPGCMIAVLAKGSDYLQPELLAMCELGASNFDSHSVLSLPESTLPAVEDYLRGRGITFQRLPIKFAFHSRWIDPAEKHCDLFVPVPDLCQRIVPIVCCSTGKILHALAPDYFWSAVRKPIRFQQTISLIESEDSVRYIDVGPSGTMATFLKHGLSVDSQSQIHQIMSPFGSDINRLTQLVAAIDSERLEVKQRLGSLSKSIQHHQAKGKPIMEPRKLRAIVFPGQGSQFKGMGKDIFPLYPEMVKAASDILGYSLDDLCLHDNQGLLSQTQYTQPALFVVNALRHVRQRALTTAVDIRSHKTEPSPDFLAGHSVGEYNALLAAGVFSFETGVRLVKKRGELMGAASDGGMAAVLGISSKEIRVILDEHGLHQIDIANFNTPTQTVIAGDAGSGR